MGRGRNARRWLAALIVGLLALGIWLAWGLAAPTVQPRPVAGSAARYTSATLAPLASASPTPLPRSTPLASASLTPQPSATPASDVCATPPSATATPASDLTTSAETIDASTREARLAQLEKIRALVDEHYLYQDFNGLDWPSIFERYQALALATPSEAAYYALLAELIKQLGDEHSRFVSPEAVRIEDLLARGDGALVGVGIMSERRGRCGLIEFIFPGSPAAEAGLERRMRILAVDGQPFTSSAALYGEPGTSLRLTLRDLHQQTREVSLERRAVSGKITPASRRLAAAPEIGYLLVPNLWANDMHSQVQAQLRDLLEAGDLRGLVLDLRANGGGWRSALVGILEQFVSGRVGSFYNDRQESPLEIEPGELQSRLSGIPLVVLIDQKTESYGELLAAILQDQDRAAIVGVPSAGNTETLYAHSFDDGSRLWLAQEAFRLEGGQDLEGRGIIPDRLVEFDWTLYDEQHDPQLLEAIRLLRIP